MFSSSSLSSSSRRLFGGPQMQLNGESFSYNLWQHYNPEAAEETFPPFKDSAIQSPELDDFDMNEADQQLSSMHRFVLSPDDLSYNGRDMDLSVHIPTLAQHAFAFRGDQWNQCQWSAVPRLSSPDETIGSSATSEIYSNGIDDAIPSAFEYASEDTSFWQPFAYSSSSSISSLPQHHMQPRNKIRGIALREIQPQPDRRDTPMLDPNHPEALEPSDHDYEEEEMTIQKHQNYEAQQNVQIMPKQELVYIELHQSTPIGSDGDDSDYTPTKTRSRKKAREDRAWTQASYRTKSHPQKDHRIVKSQKKSNPRAKSLPDLRSTKPSTKRAAASMPEEVEDEEDRRIFSCPLSPYGCEANFTSKNEWKRHVSSQHTCLGHWSCKLCGEENIFNRKDLFVQHLRRMHTSKNLASSKRKTGKMSRSRSEGHAKGKVESGLLGNAGEEEIVRDSWVEARNAPTTLECLVCDKTFEGEGCAVDWLEHVGQHISNQVKSQAHRVEILDWTRETSLRAWLLSSGVLERAGPGSNKLVMSDKAAAGGLGLNKSSKKAKKVCAARKGEEEGVNAREEDADGDAE